MALLVVGLPLLATAVAALLLRRVAVTPFGVVRRRAHRCSAPVAGVADRAGAVLLRARRAAVPTSASRAGCCRSSAARSASSAWSPAPAGSSYVAGRVLHRYARGPAALLAARRLMADPWAGQPDVRGAARVRDLRGRRGPVPRVAGGARSTAATTNRIATSTSGSLDLVDAAVAVGVAIAAAGLLVALAEGIVARRRTYAALVATGVPRATLARSILWQVFAPLVPAILLALAVGLSLVRGLSGVDDHALDRHPVRGPGGRRRHRARRRAARGRGRPAVPALQHVVGGTAHGVASRACQSGPPRRTAPTTSAASCARRSCCRRARTSPTTGSPPTSCAPSRTTRSATS